MRMRPVTTLLVLCVGFIALGIAQSQQQAAPEMRKIVRKVNPIYPDIAKRMNLSGVVKLTVTVAPDGNVKTVEAVGGNPVLIQAAENALYKWKFAAAKEETKENIDLKFDPTLSQ